MFRPPRRVPLSAIFLAFTAVTISAFFLYTRIPPSAARLLPEADAIVYLDFKPIRLATHLDQRPVPHAPDYQRFIDVTGILVERDLNSVAFALGRMQDPTGPNGAVAFTEVVIGRFQTPRLENYLRSMASAEESYAGYLTYLIPVALPVSPTTAVPTGRILRVVLLDRSTIAVSNAPTPEQIHAVIDRHRTRSYLSPFSGPTLLSGLYSEIPIFSAAWGIGAIGLPFSDSGHLSVLGFHLPLSEMTPFVASLQYVTDLRVRIEQIAVADADAERSVEKLTTVLLLVRNMQRQQTPGTNAPDIRKLTDSLKVEQHGDRAILTMDVPLSLVRHLTTPIMGAVRPETSGSAPNASK